MYKSEREAKKKEEPPREDPVKARLRLAEEEKQKKLQKFKDEAAEQANKKMGAGELALREKHKQADMEKQKKLEKMKEDAKASSSIYNTGGRDVMQNMAAAAGNNPTSGSSVGKPQVTRNPSAIKEMLIKWCQMQTKEYENVNITNFSSSWADGMAFCALIHHFYPESFDYSKLNPKNRRGNFTLAFDVAEKCANIAPLLEVDDMVMMKVPDWKCVFTYVQSFYRRFGMQQKPTSTSSASPDA
ncbi:hypothetical protein HELRODRAFT_162133 [Helobdella robusta]|uniref:Calponin-homology (CH) domain-containing protein n=1 Tax=Helobdella robusta TaxID=6412 RepID=T1ES98_HELRO|nr:hypothetical protein HELRODRAFT_162133 [Helobdella robusta]ESN98680.1 hypothetical protein HELRODRAFT_162133 [Helobdella robusta]